MGSSKSVLLEHHNDQEKGQGTLTAREPQRKEVRTLQPWNLALPTTQSQDLRGLLLEAPASEPTKPSQDAAEE